MVRKRIAVHLPAELIEKADVVAEVTDKNRTQIVTEALQTSLNDIADDERFKEAVVDHYLEDEIGVDALAAFVGRQDAESVSASRTLLDHGETIASEMAGL